MSEGIFGMRNGSRAKGENMSGTAASDQYQSKNALVNVNYVIRFRLDSDGVITEVPDQLNELLKLKFEAHRCKLLLIRH